MHPKLAALPVATQLDKVDFDREQIVCIASTGSGKTVVLAPTEVIRRKARGETGFQCWIRQPTRIASRFVYGAFQKFWPELQIGISTRDQKENVDTADIVVYSDGTLSNALKQSTKRIILYFDETHALGTISAEIDLALARKHKLLLRLLSATIDPARLVEYLGPETQVVYLEGRSFPIERRTEVVDYDELDDALSNAVKRTVAEGERALVFLPTKDDCARYAALFSDKCLTNIATGDVSPADLEAWVEANKEKTFIIFATVVAATSITIDVGRVFIVDQIVDSKYVEGVERKFRSPVGSNLALQMAGRCGRLRDGVATLLTDSEKRNLADMVPVAITTPGEKTTPYKVITSLASHGVYEDSGIELLSRLDPAEMKHAREWLVKHRCIGDDGQLTPLGRLVDSMPVEVRYAHLIASAPTFESKLALAATIACLTKGSYNLVARKPGSREARAWFPLPLLPKDVQVKNNMPLTFARLLQRAFQARERGNTSESLNRWAEASNLVPRQLAFAMKDFEDIGKRLTESPRERLLKIDLQGASLARDVAYHVARHDSTVSGDRFRGGWGWSNVGGRAYSTTVDGVAKELWPVDDREVVGFPRIIVAKSTKREFVSLECPVVFGDKEWL